MMFLTLATKMITILSGSYAYIFHRFQNILCIQSFEER